MIYPTWAVEIGHQKHGYKTIVGIDEVGRGAWAGPLVAAAYHFTIRPDELQLQDSKQATASERQHYQQSLAELGTVGIGLVSSQEIDDLGLQPAQFLAYTRALAALPIEPDIILLDGRPWSQAPFLCQAIVDGDATVMSIAAASIMAKEYRDHIMKGEIERDFPHYGFARHVGYGTREHQQALRDYGPCRVHRFSYKPIQAYARQMNDFMVE